MPRPSRAPERADVLAALRGGLIEDAGRPERLCARLEQLAAAGVSPDVLRAAGKHLEAVLLLDGLEARSSELAALRSAEQLASTFCGDWTHGFSPSRLPLTARAGPSTVELRGQASVAYGALAERLVVTARCDTGPELFWIFSGDAGVSLTPGARGASSLELRASLPAARRLARLDPEAQARAAALSQNLERLVVASAWLGALRWLFERCKDLLAGQDGAVLRLHQHHRMQLAELEIAYELCKNTVRAAAPGLAGATQPTAELAAAKQLVTGHAEEAARFALALSLGTPLEERAEELAAAATAQRAESGEVAQTRSVIGAATLARGGRRSDAGLTLSPEERRAADDFAEFCRSQLAPHAVATDTQGQVPPEAWRLLAGRGYLRFFHEAAVGGLGLGPAPLALAMESLSGTCASLAWKATISSNVCGRVLAKLGRPAHHARWLAPLLAGEVLACIAIVESVGSDFASYRTFATRRAGGTGYTVRGDKATVTNAPAADLCIVYTLVEEGAALMLIDTRAPGVSRQPYDKTGLRGMPWGRIGFDDVEVPPEDVLVVGPVQAVLGAVLGTIDWGLLFQSSCSLGLAEAALASTLAFHTGRQAYGRPTLEIQNIHGKLGEMRSQIDAARLLVVEALAHKAAGREAGRLCRMAKIYSSELTVRLAIDAIRLHGSAGIRADYPVERVLRDSLGSFYAGMSSDVLRDALAAPLLGLDPFAPPSLEWLTELGLTAG